ncbi:MAG TPA: type II toxin-antitoxin system VapC family toxin [Gemmataceae bacterium]|nr:type II toxin-antitoxin system VapC family toxin [Gemmataceae bacterium]
MLYVLDSCVAIKTILPELDSDKAIRLRDQARAGIHLLLAPEFFPMEVGHSLTRAERQLRINPPDGWNGWKAIMADCPQLYPALPLMPRAFDISSSMRIGIYDCIYVALAEREGCDFVTADDKLVKNLQSTFPFIVSLSSMP